MEYPNRKSNRLSTFDYNTPGAYFLTICTQNRTPILGEVVGGGALDAPYVHLTAIGEIVRRNIISGNLITGITVDKFTVMPNHIHLILLIDKPLPNESSKEQSPANALIPHFVSTLKRFCHRDIGSKIFQRSYHDHIIRSEKDYLKIWEYIDNNPARWKEDCFYQDCELS